MASRLSRAPVCPAGLGPRGQLSPHPGESAGSCLDSEGGQGCFAQGRAEKGVLPGLHGTWRRYFGRVHVGQGAG